MTPEEIKTAIRYHFVDQTSTAFIGDTEVYSYIRAAEADLNNLIKCCESTDESLISDGVKQEYTLPSGINEIKRVKWYKVPLKKITERDGDALDFPSYAGTPQTGDATHYYEWGGVIGVWPIPTTSHTFSIRYIAEPGEVTATAVLPVPGQFHTYLVDYALYRMYLKDQDEIKAGIHLDLWTEHKRKAMTEWRQRKRGNQFSTVKDEEYNAAADNGII